MAKVVSVSKDTGHNFSKIAQQSIRLLEGLGVEGDAHCGEKVKHPYLVKKNPDQPNLRQVHLFHIELLEELCSSGFDLLPGSIGENITTSGLDILALPTDTILKIGAEAEIKITGIRSPCIQLDQFQQGLTKAMIDKDESGKPDFKSGIMAVVTHSGTVNIDDDIQVILPPEPHVKLQPL